MSIKAVLFDIGGVLFMHGEWDYRRDVAHRLGLGETLPHAYNLHMEQLQRGEIDERDVWAAIAGRPVDPTEFDDVYEKYYRPQPAMFDLARELRERGLRTAILSNTQPSHVACMRRMDIFEGFDPLIFSNEAGRRKPEPEAFQLVLDGLGLAADEVLFIDDVAPYVEAARQVGLQGLVHGGDIAATRQAVLALL